MNMYTMWYERVSRWYEKTWVRKTRYSAGSNCVHKSLNELTNINISKEKWQKSIVKFIVVNAFAPKLKIFSSKKNEYITHGRSMEIPRREVGVGQKGNTSTRRFEAEVEF